MTERGRRLAREEYGEGAVAMAKRLLGAWLCRREKDGAVWRARITETEAYVGEEDSACHAHRGKTERTAVMYERGGVAYVYLCYGIHEMLNVVTGAEGRPEAVLIRGVEGYGGPGRLTAALGIGRDLNGEDLAESERLWIEDDGARPEFEAGRRIGIGYATAKDQARKWRFRVRGAGEGTAQKTIREAGTRRGGESRRRGIQGRRRRRTGGRG